MYKLKATWAPFPQEYSSCSSFKPEDFEWSKIEGIATVWIDRNMLNHNGAPDKNFGWFCESSEILPDIKKYLLQNATLLKGRFQNIFTCDSEIISKDPSFFIFNPPGSNLPWIPKSDYRIPNKTKICSMLCSSKDMTTGHKLRLDIAAQLKGTVDLFGGAHGSPRSGTGKGPNNDWWRSKEPALAPYMFSIAFENAKYDGYYTEKITDCFALGVIPIYWGDPLIGSTFDMNGIVECDGNFHLERFTKEFYDSKIESIKRNLEIVRHLKSADDLLFDNIIRK